MSRHPACQKGLTLIEILTVMAVIGILAAISVPAIINYLPKYRLYEAGGQLFSNLQRAKQEAIRINGECAVYFDGMNNRYLIANGGLDSICDGLPVGNPPVPQNDDILLKQITLSHYGSGVQYGSGSAVKSVPGKPLSSAITITYNKSRVRFDAKGMSRDRGYVYLTNIEGAAFAVGTPSFAGAVVRKRWLGNVWE